MSTPPAPAPTRKPASADNDALSEKPGGTGLKYHLRAVDDLHAWLVEQGDWVPLGAADEQKRAAPGTVEAWGRSDDNPVGGWYGLRKGYRGRFVKVVRYKTRPESMASADRRAL